MKTKIQFFLYMCFGSVCLLANEVAVTCEVGDSQSQCERVEIIRVPLKGDVKPYLRFISSIGTTEINHYTYPEICVDDGSRFAIIDFGHKTDLSLWRKGDWIGLYPKTNPVGIDDDIYFENRVKAPGVKVLALITTSPQSSSSKTFKINSIGSHSPNLTYVTINDTEFLVVGSDTQKINAMKPGDTVIIEFGEVVEYCSGIVIISEALYIVDPSRWEWIPIYFAEDQQVDR